MSAQSSQYNEAVVRLVQAIKPSSKDQQHHDSSSSSSIDLAHRLMSSQLGGGAPLEGGGGHSPQQFALTWRRRIQGQMSPNSSQDVEHLYQDLTHACGRKHPDLPAKIMTVLTKCVGNGRKSSSNLMTPPVAGAAPTSQRTTTTMSQHHHAPPPPNNNNNSTTAMMVEPATAHHQMSDALEYEEEQVLRELLYAMQGIEGERIKFYIRDEHQDDNMKLDGEEEEDNGPVAHYEGIRVLSPALYPHKFRPSSHHHHHRSSRLGSGAMDALRICGEAGWLVKRLQRYVDFHLNTTTTNNHNQQFTTAGGGGGRVARALARAVAHELQSYYDTLSQWEVYLSTWSLRQWLVQIQRHDILQRLTVLAMLTEALPTGVDGNGGRGVGGGTLLSALHAHSLHGDPRHKSLVQSILYPTSQPWFHMLYLWTTQGLLPGSWGGDFFVTLQNSYVVNNSSHHRQNGNRNNNNNSGNHQRTGGGGGGGEHNSNKHLWHDKYTLDKAQIPHPGLFDPELVKPAFVVGKGINFIRTCLNQIGWTLQLEDHNMEDNNNTTTKDSTTTTTNKSRVGSEEEEENKADESEQANMERLGYHYVANPIGMHHNPRLTQTLLRAERLVHSHILQSLRRDHNLLDHLFALKQFMFHGQGDFYSSLLEGLYVEFGCGTKSRQQQAANNNTSFVTAGHTVVAGVYPQQLLAILETALRRTNAKDLPDFCLERLKVEMLPFEPGQEASIGHGLFTTPTRNAGDINEHDNNSEDNRTVWDVFMLDYTVPDPLIAIVHEKAMDQYKLVYSFLFGLRKVEYMLNRTWRQSATLQHALQMMAQNNGLQTSSSVGYAHATILLRKISMTRQAMTHFCVNLKSYCMLEVLEGGWKELLERLEQARTLDEAIHAHDCYLEGICRKTLLLKGKRARGSSPGDTRRNGSSGSSSNNNNNKFRHLFGVLLNIASEFCILQERLFDEALLAAERVAQRRREAEQRMTHGQWGFENEQDLAEEESFFGLANASELAEVVKLSEGFHQCMQSFLEALDAKVNGRSRNLSTSADVNDGDDFGEMQDASELTRPSFFAEALGDEQDVDALRFLALQLDHNHYYGLLQRN